MGAATVGTIVIVGVIVAALALYVLAIGAGLTRLSKKLGVILAGLQAIKDQTRPVEPVLGGILGDVTDMESALSGLLVAVGQALGAPSPAATPTMADAVARARGNGELPAAAAGDEEAEYEEDEYEEGDYEEAEEPASVPAGAGARAGGSRMRDAVAAARARLEG